MSLRPVRAEYTSSANASPADGPSTSPIEYVTGTASTMSRSSLPPMPRIARFGSSGDARSLAEVVAALPLRRYEICTASPGFERPSWFRSSTSVFTGVPLTAVITSPEVRPAARAGDPPGSAVSSTRTPRVVILTSRPSARSATAAAVRCESVMAARSTLSCSSGVPPGGISAWPGTSSEWSSRRNGSHDSRRDARRWVTAVNRKPGPLRGGSGGSPATLTTGATGCAGDGRNRKSPDGVAAASNASVMAASTARAPPAAAPLTKARRTNRTIAVAPSAAIGFNGAVAETRGMRFLRQRRVAFDVHIYEHLEKGAEFAADALGLPLERFAKTLVVEAGGDPVFALMPGGRELSLKKLARAAGA